MTIFCGELAWAQIAHPGGLVSISALGASAAIPKPTLELLGGPLLLSDSPEQFKSTAQLPAVMYRDRVTGDFRVFYHHQNETSKSVLVGVAITNTSSRPEIVFVRGTGESVNQAPDLAGQAAASSFLSSRHSLRFTTLLLPGKTYYRVQNLPKGDTVSGILEYLLVAAPGETRSDFPPRELVQTLSGWSTSEGVKPLKLPTGFSFGSATVSTVAYIGEQPPDAASLPILRGDTHIRGTFAHSDRSGTFVISSAAGLQSLSIDTSAPGGQFSNPMRNEYELGSDAVDSGKPVYDDGNYGVIYDLHATVDSSSSSPTIALFIEPSGGSGHFVVLTNAQPALSPYVTHRFAWWFSNQKLQGRQTHIHLQTTLPGGASGPQDLLFDPGFGDR